MNTIKILHSESSLGWGGQEKRILLEMEVLRKRGCEVHLACQSGSNIGGKAKDKGFFIHVVAMHPWFHPRTLFGLARLLKDERFSVVHTHSSADSWALGVAAKFLVRPALPVFRTRHLSTPVRGAFVYTRLADKIITTGASIRSALVRRGVREGKIVSIPTGVDLSAYRASAPAREQLRCEWGLADKTVLIGNVAVLRSWKGHDDFLEAAKRVHAQYPNTQFVIVGDGPQRQRLEKRVHDEALGDTVRFAGYRDDVSKILCALDIFLFTSYANEGVPQAVTQAMATGVPVVATRVGSVEDVIEDGKTGLLAQPRNVEDISQKVLALLKDPQLAQRLAQAGQAFIVSQLSLEQMEEKLEQFYAQTIRTPGIPEQRSPSHSRARVLGTVTRLMAGDRPGRARDLLAPSGGGKLGTRSQFEKTELGHVPNFPNSEGIAGVGRVCARIALIRQKVSPRGGAESVVHRLAGELAKRGHDVHVLAAGWEDPLAHVTYHRMPVTKTISWVGALSFQRSVRKFLRTNCFDVIHGFDKTYPVDVYRAGDGCHRAWLDHAGQGMSPLRKALLWLDPKNWVLLGLEKRLLSHPHLKMVIANSQLVCRELLKYHRLATDKVTVIHNGIDVAACHAPVSREERQQNKRALGLDPNATVLLFVGSNFYRKGLRYALEAFARHKEKSLVLLVAGKGREKGYRRFCAAQGIADKVRFLGKVQDTRALYEASDLLLLPTLYDPFSNVCLEAMAHGMPVLTTPTNGASEAIAQGKTGWVVSPEETPEALDLALREDLWTMGRAALEACKGHTFSAMTDQILEVYAIATPRIA